MYVVLLLSHVIDTDFPFTDVIETKNRTLEETAALFDGEDAVEQLAGAAGHAAHDEKDGSSGSLHDEKVTKA